MFTHPFLTLELAQQRQAELRLQAAFYRPRRPIRLDALFDLLLERVRPRPRPAHGLACATC